MKTRPVPLTHKCPLCGVPVHGICGVELSKELTGGKALPVTWETACYCCYGRGYADTLKPFTMEKWNVDEADRLLGIVAECHRRKEAVKRMQDADGTASFVGTKERSNNASIVGPKEQDGTATANDAINGWHPYRYY